MWRGPNMNRCSDNLNGSPSFTISTTKTAAGYTATCDSLPSLPPCVDVEEIDAIRAMSRQVEAFVVNGGQGAAVEGR